MILIYRETGAERKPGMNRTDSETSEAGNYLSRVQNATQNVMGKISGMGTIGSNISKVSNISGIANKFGGGFFK